jgi:hypothetical protein
LNSREGEIGFLSKRSLHREDNVISDPVLDKRLDGLDGIICYSSVSSTQTA